MQNAILAAYTNCASTDARQEFERWWEQHVVDVLTIPGFVRATKYRKSRAQGGKNRNSRHEYLVVYEIVSDDVAATMGLLDSAPFPTSPALAKDAMGMVFIKQGVVEAGTETPG